MPEDDDEMFKPIQELLSQMARAFEKQEKEFLFQNEIDFPLEVNNVSVRHGRTENVNVGKFVSIRPVEDDKTYLGLYLGDFPIDYYYMLRKADKTLVVAPNNNPAIFVFDLNRIVYGVESWWGIIEKPEDLKVITDADIEDIWYVKALRALDASQ